MITIRSATERGMVNFGWLDTKHTFSFGNYYDPNYMGFATLRVINEDKVEPEKGFATHGHKDMEIITYVLEGALKHQDSIGNGSIIKPGDVQRMSAGTGIYHSEFNASDTDLVHLLQIWILPKSKDLPPSYEQKYFAPEEKQGKLKLIASGNGRDGSVLIHQNVDLYASILSKGDVIIHELAINRKAWIQIARGSVKINGQALNAGDGVAISEEPKITLEAVTNAEILLFDLG